MGQTQLADFLRVSASTVGMYEQELSVPDMDALVQLAQLLDVSLDYLITGKKCITNKPDSFARLFVTPAIY